MPSLFIEPLSVPMRPPSDGVVVVLGVVVDVVPPLELMLPELGAVVSDELGAAVLGDVVLGDVALGEVVLGDVVLGDVVLGDAVLGVVVLVESLLGGAAVPGVAVLGDCVPGDVELGELLLEPVPLVCAYTRPAATASATLVLAAMYLNLLIDNSMSRSGWNEAGVSRLWASNSRQSPCPSAARTARSRWFQRVRVGISPSRASLANSFRRL